MKCKINHKARNSLLLLGLLLLSACATTTTEPEVSTAPQVSSIEERSTARWNAVFSGDLSGAYQYLSPGFRSSVSSMQYQRSILLKPVQWTSAKYMESNCQETTCDVRFQVGYRVVGALPGVKSYEGKQDVHESWILIDGLWYFVPGS
jgi:hypothetical protein